MQNLTDCSHLASPYFTVENLKATWALVVYPVGPQLAWVSPDFPLMTVRPPIMRTGPGRKSKHKCFPSRVNVNNTDIVATNAQKFYLVKDYSVADNLKQQRPNKWMTTLYLVKEHPVVDKLKQ
ncbi:hypothetical protein OSB04_un000892 [Centaurea solstitialis]|uniref:Uncharacterized protein n=1 Tax=Centaurea solstitialis TaxID=347529 RepID=A0AA38SH48_9ASTR|nr:hypothetical protein OSB04_un000892 [Centaurea solstitialis]